MKMWLADNWWWIWGMAAGSAYVAYRVRSRGGEESLPRRVLYVLAPVLDENSDERKQLTPRVLALAAIGLAIVALAMLFVPGFVR